MLCLLVLLPGAVRAALPVDWGRLAYPSSPCFSLNPFLLSLWFHGLLLWPRLKDTICRGLRVLWPLFTVTLRLDIMDRIMLEEFM